MGAADWAQGQLGAGTIGRREKPYIFWLTLRFRLGRLRIRFRLRLRIRFRLRLRIRFRQAYI